MAKPDPKPIGMRWDRSHGEYIVGRSFLDGVDALAVTLEAKWGNGRLRLLVGQELREKFDRQRYLLNQAITAGTLEMIRREAPRMVNAWKALDQAAEQAGANQLPLGVLEVTLDDGSVAVVAQDYDSRLAKGRAVAVYTLDEVGRILSAYRATHKAKLTWPGATVVRVDKSVPDPLDGLREATDLNAPLDDLWSQS